MGGPFSARRKVSTKAGQLQAPAAGVLGTAAASAGAEYYIVGQVLRTDAGFQLTVGSFLTATDRQVGTYQVIVADAKLLPAQPPTASLIERTSATASAANSPTDTSGGTEVTAGLPIDVHLDAPLSSGSAKVGDTFSFQAMNDVVADGWIVVPKGSQGQGEVMQAENAGGNGHAGKLGLQFDWITSSDGSKIKMSVTPRSSEGEGKAGAASTATLATYVLLGPLGLFAHNFVKGRDITIEPATKLTGYVEHTVHVKATEKSDAMPVFAH
jgi:hypothetical protein